MFMKFQELFYKKNLLKLWTVQYNGYTGEKDFKFNSIEKNDLHKESKIKSKKIEIKDKK